MPTKGTVRVRNKDIYNDLTIDGRATFRSKKFGIVYQQPNWIKSLNVVENVAFPMAVLGKSEKKSTSRASELLKLFRLEEFEKNAPTELSGGQQQRVAVVRSLIANPWILITDEPTGNLDTTSASDLMYVFQYLNSESKRTVIMVTHNPDYEKYATRVVRMEDGKITSIKVKRNVNVEEKDLKDDILPEKVTEGAKI